MSRLKVLDAGANLEWERVLEACQISIYGDLEEVAAQHYFEKFGIPF